MYVKKENNLIYIYYVLYNDISISILFIYYCIY